MLAVRGFLCVWTVTMMAGADAGPPPRKSIAEAKCEIKELIHLTKYHIEDSLADYDKANGNHLGTWPPGFPELEVHQDSEVHGSEVLCSLVFMSQGLEEVLHDQTNHLNPKAVSLHKKLRVAISTVNMLAACVKSVLGGKCPQTPPRPTSPTYTFQKKQWGRTLLKASGDYLQWLRRKLDHLKTNITAKKRLQHKGSVFHKHWKGSGYRL